MNELCDCGTDSLIITDHALWCIRQPPEVRQPELERIERVGAGQKKDVQVKPVPTTESLLSEILSQLQTANDHLESIRYWGTNQNGNR